MTLLQKKVILLSHLEWLTLTLIIVVERKIFVEININMPPDFSDDVELIVPPDEGQVWKNIFRNVSECIFRFWDTEVMLLQRYAY